MDNWKIQLVVVTFCALVQTYQALSSNVEEEIGLPLHWQVSISDLMFSSETGKNITLYCFYCRNALKFLLV